MSRRTLRAWLVSGLLLVGTGLGACLFNPQPEPPGTLRSAPAEVSSPEAGATRSIIIVSG